MNENTPLDSNDNIEHRNARFNRGLAWLIAVSILSCCTTAGIMVIHSEEIGQMFKSFMGGN